MSQRGGKSGAASGNKTPQQPSTTSSPRLTRGMKNLTLKDIMERLTLNHETGKERADATDLRLNEISTKLNSFKEDQTKLEETVLGVQKKVGQTAQLVSRHDVKIAALEKKVKFHEREKRQLNLILDGVQGFYFMDIANSCLFEDLNIGFTAEVCECIYRRGKKPLGNANMQTPPPRPIGRVRKIAVEKGRPSTSLLITGRSQVHTCAGSSESDHSGN